MHVRCCNGAIILSVTPSNKKKMSQTWTWSWKPLFQRYKMKKLSVKQQKEAKGRINKWQKRWQHKGLAIKKILHMNDLRIEWIYALWYKRHQLANSSMLKNLPMYNMQIGWDTNDKPTIPWFKLANMLCAMHQTSDGLVNYLVSLNCDPLKNYFKSSHQVKLSTYNSLIFLNTSPTSLPKCLTASMEEAGL